MPGRLQDEVETTIDQLFRLALEDVCLSAAAADQLLADLNEADSFEQMAAYHRCFLREMQRITARDVSRRIEIAAAWLGATPRHSAAAELPAADTTRDTATAPRPEQDDWRPFSLEGTALLAGAMLDATNLKQLSGVLYGPPRQRWVPAEASQEARPAGAGAAVQADSADRSGAESVRTPEPRVRTRAPSNRTPRRPDDPPPQRRLSA